MSRVLLILFLATSTAFAQQTVTLNGVSSQGMTLSADPTSNLQPATKQYVDNHGVSTVNGKAGTVSLTNVDAGAATAADPGSPFAMVANNLIATNHFYFTDYSDGWCAAPFYCSSIVQEYGSDTILTMLAFPEHFTAAQFLNLVTKFIGAKNTNGAATYPLGDFPESVKNDGTAGQFCSGDDAYCHYATGDGRIAVPLALYLYWQRTGDLTPYTSNVAAIKTAMAIPPRNATTHLITIVAGQEDIPGVGYLEQMRPLGDVADANVWDAWDAKAMQLMATAAGDTTNASYFSNIYTQDVASLTSTTVLTDPTTSMLWFATGTQMHVLDIADSTLAAYPLLGTTPTGVTPGPLLGSTQVTAISNWLNTNYSSLVNSQGYVKMVNSCDVTGIIPSTGGAPYTANLSTTQYQCGYWATFGGYFAYALGKAHPSQATTYLQAFLNGSGPGLEFYDSGGDTAQTELMTTGQSIRLASQSFPAPAIPSTSLCVLDSNGRCTTYLPPDAGTSNLAKGVQIPFYLHPYSNAALTGYNTVDEVSATSAANGAILASGIRVASSTNNAAYWDFHYVSAGSTSNHGCLDIYGINCIASWYPGDYLGADAYVGTGTAPTLSFSSGTGSLSSGSTNTAGSILISSSGAFTFTLGFQTQGSTALTAPHYWNCSFNNTATNSDYAKMTASSSSGATGWGSTSAVNEYITYICAAF